MARPGIGYYEVATACEELIGSGQEPTIERIRLILKTGSNSTIGQHLRTWKIKQDTTQAIATKEHLPEELVAMLKGLWERVMGESESRIEAIEASAREREGELKQALEQLQKENNRLLQAEAELKQSVYVLGEEKVLLEQSLAAARTDIVTLDAKFSGLEKQLEEKEARIAELHKQNQQAQANLEYYRTAMAEQRQTDNLRQEEERRRLENTIRHLEQQNSTVKHEKAELDKAFAALQQRHEAALLQSDAHLQSRDNLASELNEVKLLLAQKIETGQHWQAQYEKLFAESKAQTDKIIAFQTEIAVLNEQLSMLKSELNETKVQNRLLVTEKWELGQEKAQLAGEIKQLQQIF